MDKHWVVIAEWCVNYEGGLHIIGVFHSEKDALIAFKNRVSTDDRPLADEYGYKIYEDSDKRFDSGEEGYYCHNHIMVEVVEVIELAEPDGKLLVNHSKEEITMR